MNRIVKLSFAVLLAAAALSSCKEKEEEIVVVRAIEVSPKTLEMNAGDTEALSAVITPSNATNQDITWSSSNSEVATVSEAGIVSAISGGRATITAKSGTKTGTCEVVVKGPATAITIKPEHLSWVMRNLQHSRLLSNLTVTFLTILLRGRVNRLKLCQ